MDLLTAFAMLKGWVTAKAGRPDIHRAGNASTRSFDFISTSPYSRSLGVLRALAEGRIGWAFWPPSTPLSTILADTEPGVGIWTSHLVDRDEETEYESEEEEGDGEEEDTSSASEEESANEDTFEDDQGIPSGVGLGRFGALSLDADDED